MSQVIGSSPMFAIPPTMQFGGSVQKFGGSAQKSTGKRSSGVKKHISSHPPYGAMIKAALKHLADRKGSSRAAIFKYIIQNYKLGGNMAAINSHLRMALKRGVHSGALKQAKGTGASGSFRLGEHKVSKGRVRKTKKPRAKKTSTARRSTGTKKRVHKKKTHTKKPKAARKSSGGKRKSGVKKGGVKKARRRSKKKSK